jgi:hypothetical protein
MPKRVVAQHSRVLALAAALLFCGSPAPAGQIPNLHSVYVAGRLGGNFVGTDPEEGRSVGAGGSVGFFFTERWAVEVEAWIPSSMTGLVCGPPAPVPAVGNSPPPCGTGQFQNVVVGVSARRRFGGDGVHPYVLVGVSTVRMKYRTSVAHWTNWEGGYPQGGVGITLPLASRVALTSEVRVDYLVLGGILRPIVAVEYRLR